MHHAHCTMHTGCISPEEGLLHGGGGNFRNIFIQPGCRLNIGRPTKEILVSRKSIRNDIFRLLFIPLVEQRSSNLCNTPCFARNTCYFVKLFSLFTISEEKSTHCSTLLKVPFKTRLWSVDNLQQQGFRAGQLTIGVLCWPDHKKKNTIPSSTGL